VGKIYDFYCEKARFAKQILCVAIGLFQICKLGAGAFGV